ncbi:hypothetical protein [Halarcobacter anaerophilus]|uniref:hypothetical protein n=1 Tax=Halarcobacter anaerophilus TaxID=877500 RepID=UPI0005C966D3|nr:hypothetical protein [Halarcobacter anaerophilus]
MCAVRDKIKKLRAYKVYNYSIFDEKLKKSAISFICRASKSGNIIKIGKGKFYKRPSKNKLYNEVPNFYNKPTDKSALKYNMISPSKYPIFKHLFWSNRNNPIPLDNYIGVVLSKDNPCSLPYLRSFFGDRKVYEIYLNEFYQKGRRLPLIEEFLEI